MVNVKGNTSLFFLLCAGVTGLAQSTTDKIALDMRILLLLRSVLGKDVFQALRLVGCFHQRIGGAKSSHDLFIG